MDSIQLKNHLARRILDMQNEALLKKVERLLNKGEIVGYEADGTPVYAQDYLKEMAQMDAAIDQGNLSADTTDTVRKTILG